MKQWIAVENLVVGIQDIVSEREFLDRCEAAGVSDAEVREWGLETLSVAGLLR
ncbi:hypothetical protein [Alcaligenes aquatilis]|uniref:hypothetical protein n=1 Tax=Alcaligenes aquatilis TaxID=323284 RepID=UPI0013CE6DD1|nr:hypothetical protein [Alcaligenes aquatilis]